MRMRILNKPRSPPIRDIPAELSRIEPARTTSCCYERWKSMRKFEICTKGLRPAGRKICWYNSTGLKS